MTHNPFEPTTEPAHEPTDEPTPRPTPGVPEGKGADVVHLDTRRQLTPATPPADAEEGDGPVLDGTIVQVDRQVSHAGEDWLAELAGKARERRPIVPGWLRSRSEATSTLKWVSAHYAHVAGYHVTRAPKYALKLAARSPRGAARVVRGSVRWTFDLEGLPVRVAAVRKADAETYLRLSRQRDSRVRLRVSIAVAGAVVLGLASLLIATAPTPAQWAALASLVGLLGALGSPPDRPLLDRAVVATKVERLTSAVVIDALAALGIAEVNKAMAKGGRGITFPAPITRDGPGWRADVDLPLGVTVTDIMERRDRLASGLRRPLGCVWPESAPGQHAGRLVLWVGDQDMSQAKAPAWPLARTGTADLFKAIPFGHDQRMRPVTLPLMYSNVLIGAMPGAGKTFALRVLLLAAALDPTAELRLFELKGSGDLSVFETVAHHYGSGPDDDTLYACLVSLREVHKDLEKRAKTLSGLPRDICPENKVTPQLAAKRSLGLHPLVVGIDECQELFSHAEFGKEAGELCTAIIKRGRALGVILLLATQRPDKDSLPTGVSANVGVRFCLRVMGQVENDMVLGTSAYRNGIRATTFSPRDKGIGYLVGAADDPQIVRSAYLDGPASERIVGRAHAARKAAGTLSGHATGEAPADKAPAFDLLADVLAVVPAGEGKVWSEVVVSRLAELRPGIYGEWDTETLATMLKPHGIETGQILRRIEGKAVNRRGIDRARVAEVVAERNRNRPA
ncbi:FtsK/SpoIIIE domain-containing protein [Microbispora sp. H10949]|uniref:FtsK/SpoIIIE domain-containing protein n=1 Tax=Microbispora sp. H10949 TaxID=2729111 RepID=UPI0016022924|nr:FtsK/SpoIIIE domain-containing protein [Microbispora sp. H10949]